MPPSPETLVAFLLVGLAALVLYFNLGRALLCLAPSVRIEAEAPADKAQAPAELSPLERELRSLGFRPLGSRYEKPRLGRGTVSYDYAQEAERVFATLYLGRQGSPRLYFLSQTDQAAFVISANYRRPAREVPGRYFSAGLEGCAPERVYRAHLKRVASFGKPVGRFDQEGRVEAARAWFAGPGQLELRLGNLQGLVWSLGALGVAAAAIFGNQ